MAIALFECAIKATHSVKGAYNKNVLLMQIKGSNIQIESLLIFKRSDLNVRILLRMRKKN